MNASPKLKVLLVGYGQRGMEYANIYASRPDIEIVGVVEPDPRHRALAAELGSPCWATTDEVTLDRIDGVIICTPPAQRRATIEWAMATGAAIVCEKPLALTEAEGEEIVRLCARAGVDLMVGYTTRYKWPFRTLQELLASGELGELVSVWLCKTERFPRSRWDRIIAENHWRARPDSGGGRHIERSHQLDWLTWVGGEVRDLRGDLASVAPGIAVDDVYSAYVQFGRGVGLISVALTPVTGESTTAGVVGTRGAATFDGQALRLSTAERELIVPREERPSFWDETVRFIRTRERPVSNQVTALTTLRAALALSQRAATPHRSLAHV